MAHKLPYALTIKAIRRGPQAVEAACDVRDAEGESVEHLPVSMGPKVTAGEVCAILQGHVEQLAKSHHARGAATLGDGAPEDSDIASLVGRTFTAGVSR
jgi:hypothetical protein